MTAFRTKFFTPSAMNTTFFGKRYFGFQFLRLRIMTPKTMKRTPFQKNHGSYAVPVVRTKFLYIKNITVHFLPRNLQIMPACGQYRFAYNVIGGGACQKFNKFAYFFGFCQLPARYICGIIRAFGHICFCCSGRDSVHDDSVRRGI